ncbi:hypothetical protein C2G38_2182606 [Gigaspora rosea]|uniref:Uncharacterized protein n=1 Tax=Gigaspora rosea TaxID=44941 RepID=A0A397V9E0_9GLOM|nr:hypothetical protein C2G38_2182606 [Gigaspora rosea]
MNNNTIIKNKKLPLFSLSSNIRGDYNTIFDDSTEFSLIYWLFDTMDDSKNKFTVEACGSQNACETDNNFDQLNTNIKDLSFCGDLSFYGNLLFHRDFLEVDEDTEPLRLDVLKDNFD